MKSIISGFLTLGILLVGCSRALRTCSHADDAARAGNYTTHLDDVRYARNYNSMSTYNTLTKVAIEEKNIENILEAKNIIEKEELLYLKETSKELKTEIEKIENTSDLLLKDKQLEKIRKVHIDENSEQYKEILKTVLHCKDIQEWYNLEGEAYRKENKKLAEEKVFLEKKFSYRIPKGFYNVSSLHHPKILNLFVNEDYVITIFKTSNEKSNFISDWRKYKSENPEMLILNQIDNTTYKYFLKKNLFDVYGYLKVDFKDGKALYKEIEFYDYGTQSSFAKSLIEKI